MQTSPFHLFARWGEIGSPYPKALPAEGGTEKQTSSQTSQRLGFYRSWKPYLHSASFYDFILGKESYFEFQKKLSILAEESFGVSLALSCMVEVNVAGGVLTSSCYANPGSHPLWNVFFQKEPICILSVGVSEPGFEGKLKKLNSQVSSGKLTGKKSFITNGGEADFIFWVTKTEEKNPVYWVPVPKPEDSKFVLEKEEFHTDFACLVSHLRLFVSEYPIPEDSLLLEDYGPLGMELRLKEMCSLVSLLIGKTKVLSLKNPKIAEERNKLIQWQETFLSPVIGNPTKELLLEGFPYPIDTLIQTITSHYQLEKPEDLKTIDPDWQLFLWEDSFTKYLTQKKKRNLS